MGTVRDPVAIESRPAPDTRMGRDFVKAATKAALQFRYLPKYVDGEPIEVQGVRNRMTFDLSD